MDVPFFYYDHDDPLDAQFPNFAFSPPLPLPLDPIPIVDSASLPYVGPEVDELAFADPNCQLSNNQNIHTRRTGPNAGDHRNQEAEQSQRKLRHVMKERERRERLSQSYADLHSMLTPGTKKDKVSIVQSATAYLRQLKEAKEVVERRSYELENTEIVREVEVGEGRDQVIKVYNANTSSAMNSAIEALTCIKGMEAKATSILFYVNGQKISAVMGVEKMKVANCEVERALEATLTKTYIEDTS